MFDRCSDFAGLEDTIVVGLKGSDDEDGEVGRIVEVFAGVGEVWGEGVYPRHELLYYMR
jgi:hypothetical protein